MYSVTFYCPEDQSEFTISHEKWERVVIEVYTFIDTVVNVDLSLITCKRADVSLQTNLSTLHRTISSILHYGIYVGTHNADKICYDVNGLKRMIKKAIIQFERSIKDLDEDERADMVSKVEAHMRDVYTLIDQYFSHL
jgi:predicted component of type VI protein secretion system